MNGIFFWSLFLHILLLIWILHHLLTIVSNFFSVSLLLSQHLLILFLRNWITHLINKLLLSVILASSHHLLLILLFIKLLLICLLLFRRHLAKINHLSTSIHHHLLGLHLLCLHHLYLLLVGCLLLRSHLCPLVRVNLELLHLHRRIIWIIHHLLLIWITLHLFCHLLLIRCKTVHIIHSIHLWRHFL